MRRGDVRFWVTCKLNYLSSFYLNKIFVLTDMTIPLYNWRYTRIPSHIEALSDLLNTHKYSLSLSLYIYIYIYILDIGVRVRVFANGPEDLGPIPSWVIPKAQKMVLDASLLNTQHYKVRIKGKVEQSRERSSSLPYNLV